MRISIQRKSFDITEIINYVDGIYYIIYNFLVNICNIWSINK